MEQGVAHVDAFGLECIDKLEQLPKPTSELHTRLPALAVVLGHAAQDIEMFRRGSYILRSSLSAIGEDGAFMRMTARATARRLAALASQGVKRARQ